MEINSIIETHDNAAPGIGAGTLRFLAALFPEKSRKRKEEKNFKTPAGQAALAARSGRKIFQYMEVITETRANVVPMIGVYTTDERGITGLQEKSGRENSSAIEQIEAEGWKLINVGYVFQQTSAESRDKFLSSGQQEAIGGRVLGIYTFRRTTGE